MIKKIVLGFSMLMTVLPLVLADVGEGDGCLGRGGMMGGASGYGGIIFGWAFGVLMLVALVLLIVWLAKMIQKK